MVALLSFVGSAGVTWSPVRPVASAELQKAFLGKQTLRFFLLQIMVTVAALSLADVVLEKAMHKCILKPLKGHVEAMLRDFHMADGSWKQLKENLQLVRQRNPQELGVFAPTPDIVDVEKIKVKFMTMQKMYSPEKKVMLLLRVCKLIYTVMENNSGELSGLLAFPARARDVTRHTSGSLIPSFSLFQSLHFTKQLAKNTSVTLVSGKSATCNRWVIPRKASG